ncbi:CHASE3 domain-containing protein [Streptomyces sp. NBC_00237]|uniref:sensor histidine kinase n=1 Tax=Streptomyces sp. NBC_00237 TaxID=2975687 RepID=UPI00225405B3|nr:sensor histidine kinase [Streptomyces sp. NBC_00237]MCX5201319.1 CHASE3 domain-containing protein [Streptomyces sp. NBC_00237]
MGARPEASDEGAAGAPAPGRVVCALRGRFARLSVRGWIRFVLLAMAVLLAVCAGLGASLLSRTNDRNADLVDHLQPGRSATLLLHRSLLDQETGVRGYALSGQPAFLDPYVSGVREEPRQLRETARLLGDRPPFADDLDAVRDKAAQWRRTQAEPLIAAIRGGASVAAVQPRVAASKKSFDELRALLDVQERHMDEARLAARADIAGLRTLRDVTFLVMLGVIAATGVLLSLLLSRMVVRPLAALRTAAEQVAGGEFDRRIEVPGPSDVRAVGASVDLMRRRIAGELAEVRQREAQLAAQAADLDGQTVELRRSNAELEQFAYVASHDLQEPLRKVASFCQLLEKRYGDVVDDRGKQYIAFAVDGAKRMQTLINDLLTFSRVGRLDADPVAVDMGAALERALANLAAAVEESAADIVVRDLPLPVVTGDPTSFAMLWQNLIGNAVKFRHPERLPVRIEVGCEKVGGDWEFTVRDNGIGVPREFADKVFVLFQRLHSREEYAGTGIGLALCRKIVEYYGGSIRLEDAGGGEPGALVRFSLPVAGEQGTGATGFGPGPTS